MISLVGHRQGRRVIRWGYVVLATFLFAAIGTFVAAGLYYVLADQWTPVAFLAGAGAGLFATVLTLLAALRTPLHQLPLLKWFNAQ
jgi:hypothetical protein